MHHDQTERMGRCRRTWTFRLSPEREPVSHFAGLWCQKEGTGQYPLIEPEIVPQLDAVLLSHAHEDHSVAIPLLYKMGYQGEVWTTRGDEGAAGYVFFGHGAAAWNVQDM